MNPSKSAPAVTHDLQMQVVVDDGHRVALPATLQYSAHDPFAITATFRTGDGDISWVFSRDLLRDGLRDAVGQGDILVRPAHPSRGPLTIISLTSPSGSATIEGSRQDLAAFIDEIYDAVPDGAEWMYLDLDGTIAHLLGDGPMGV